MKHYFECGLFWVVGHYFGWERVSRGVWGIIVGERGWIAHYFGWVGVGALFDNAHTFSQLESIKYQPRITFRHLIPSNTLGDYHVKLQF